MKIGIPKEIKNNENRVSLTPAGAAILSGANHEVFVETNAGIGSNFTDEEYIENGAKIVKTAKEAWATDIVMKVKEPLQEEYQYFRQDLILFTYLHLAPEIKLTKALQESGVTAIGYETMSQDGSLPLLTPMSQVAGRMSVQIGAQFLEKQYGGKGILLGAVPGVQSGKVVIIGGGVSGTHAAQMAAGLGANVTILELNPTRINELQARFGNEADVLMSNEYNIAESIKDADLVIGAVLIPGAKTPTLVSEEMIKEMQAGSVIVDIAIDQGGIFETTDQLGSHDNPIYVKYGILHYAVPNMPGAVPRTATVALTNVSVNYALEIANKGFIEVAKHNSVISTGVNVYQGKLTNKQVANSQSEDYFALENLIK